MNDSYWIFLAFVPPLLLYVDLAELLLKRRPNTSIIEAPRMQIWLQDMFVLSLMFVLSMAWGFDSQNWYSAVFPVLAVVLGFIAAVDVASPFKSLSPMRRTTVFVATMASFIVCIWLAAILWYLWKRFSVRRRGLQLSDRASHMSATFSALLYFIAFCLPMVGKKAGNEMGWVAYYMCFTAAFTPGSADEFNVAYLAWLANPCFWIATAFLLEGRRMTAAAFAIISVAMGFAISNSDDYTLSNSPAYFYWLFSMTLLAILSLVLASRHYRSKQSAVNV